MKNKKINFIFASVIIGLVVLVSIWAITNQKAPEMTGEQVSIINVSLSVTETLDAIISSTRTAIFNPTPTSIRFTPAPSTMTPFVIPNSFYLRNIVGTGQYFSIGCEASAAADWANYFDVLIYEYNFQRELPLSDNPDLGFVGDAKGPWGQIPPFAYGVHAEPVAALLRKYGLDAVAGKGFSLDQVKEKLAQSKPVIAWVIGNMEGGVPTEYTDEQGNKTIVAAYEHVVILTGYDQDSIRYMSNGKFYDAPYDVFLHSWGVLGNMAVMHR